MCCVSTTLCCVSTILCCVSIILCCVFENFVLCFDNFVLCFDNLCCVSIILCCVSIIWGHPKTQTMQTADCRLQTVQTMQNQDALRPTGFPDFKIKKIVN